jgi:hypothetical protein
MYYTPEILNAQHLSEVNESTARSVSSAQLIKVWHYNIDIPNQRVVHVSAKRRYDHQYHLWAVETVKDAATIIALFWVNEDSDIKRLNDWSVASAYAKIAHEKLWKRGHGWVYNANMGKLMYKTGGFLMDTERAIDDRLLRNAIHTYDAQKLYGRDFEEAYARTAERGQNA